MVTYYTSIIIYNFGLMSMEKNISRQFDSYAIKMHIDLGCDVLGT